MHYGDYGRECGPDLKILHLHHHGLDSVLLILPEGVRKRMLL